MKITDALRDRASAKLILDPTAAHFETGTLEERAAARAEWHRGRFAHQVMSSELEEIPRERLQPLRGARLLEDTETGDFYVPRRDGLMDLEYAKDVVAYYCDPTGAPVLLERPASGAKSRAELEQIQAEREERRRNRPKPTWAAPR